MDNVIATAPCLEVSDANGRLKDWHLTNREGDEEEVTTTITLTSSSEPGCHNVVYWSMCGACSINRPCFEVWQLIANAKRRAPFRAPREALNADLWRNLHRACFGHHSRRCSVAASWWVMDGETKDGCSGRNSDLAVFQWAMSLEENHRARVSGEEAQPKPRSSSIGS